MEITKELLARIAANARLKLTAKEEKEFLPQLKEILSSFDELAKLDVRGIPPSFLPTKPEHKLREDKAKPKECIDRETALSLTPHKERGYYKGPRVM